MMKWILYFLLTIVFVFLIKTYNNWILFFGNGIYGFLAFILYILIIPILSLFVKNIRDIINNYLGIFIIPLSFFIFNECINNEQKITIILIIVFLFFLFIINNENINYYDNYLKFIEGKKYFSDKKYKNISSKFYSKLTVKKNIDENNIGYLELVLNSKTINFYIKHNLPNGYLGYEDFLNIPIPKINKLFTKCSSEEEFERLLIKSYGYFTEDEVEIILKNE